MKVVRWNSIEKVLPAVGLEVEALDQDGGAYDCSLFDIDHSKMAIIRFLVHGEDKVQFSFPKKWRFKQGKK